MTAIQLTPAASSDDGFWREDTSAFGTTGAFSTGNYSGLGSINGFVRFADALSELPAGATITAASLALVAYTSQSGTVCRLRIRAVAADDPAAPTTYAEAENATRTTASTSWQPAATTADLSYDSPDFAAVVQEIVDRPGWAAGQHLLIYIEDDGSDGSARRQWHAQDTGFAPVLTVEFTETEPPPPPPPPPGAATRFADWRFEVDTGSGFVPMETGGVSDLRGALDLNRGLPGASFSGRVARVGVLQATLDNRDRRYSPDSAGALAGFEVGAACRLRVQIGTGGEWETLFVGLLDEIRPAYGMWGERVAHIRAVDDMERLEQARVGARPGQAFIGAGTVAGQLVSSVYTPPAQSVDNGQGVDFIGLQATDSVRGALGQLVDTEGYPAAAFTRRDGTFVFEDRTRRQRITSPIDWTLVDEMADLVAVRRRGDLYRRVIVTLHPTVTSPSLEDVGVLSQVPAIAPGETRLIRIPYQDPDNTGATEFLATNVQDLAPVNDLKIEDAPDGGGDVSADCVVVHTKGASASEVQITNNGKRTAYVTRLHVRGQGVRRYDDQTFIVETAAPVQNDLEIDFAFNSSQTAAIALAERVALQAASAERAMVTDLYVKPRNASLLAMILTADISQRVALAETQTAIDAAYLVNAVRLRLDVRGYAEAHFELEPETTRRAWLLGIAGRSEIGETTWLG